MVRSGSSIAGLDRWRLGLLGAVGPQVEHRQLHQPAEAQPAEQPGAVADLGGLAHPDRHPLVVRPVRRAARARGSRPRRRCGSPRRAPLVVGDLVVVPGRDEGGLGVQAPAGRGPACTARGGAGSPARLTISCAGSWRRMSRVALAVAVLAGAVLVDVVAQVQHGVEVVAVGQVPVRRRTSRPAGWRRRPRPKRIVAVVGLLARGRAGAAGAAGLAA